jgi:putative transposase
MSPRWPVDPDMRRGRSVVHHLQVHLVFVTRYRRGVLDGEMLGACERIMRGLCAEMGAELREFNGGHDHVHLLVGYPPKLAVSTLVNRLKAVSAHYLRTEFTSRISPHLVRGRLWSPSYFAVSAGNASLTVIKQYIDNHNQPDQTHPESPGPERPGTLATYR